MLPEGAPWSLRGTGEMVELACRDSYSGLEAGRAHQGSPLLTMWAGRPAITLEGGRMSNLVAENLA